MVSSVVLNVSTLPAPVAAPEFRRSHVAAGCNVDVEPAVCAKADLDDVAEVRHNMDSLRTRSVERSKAGDTLHEIVPGLLFPLP